MHTARGQWDVMSKRRPIPTVVADPSTPSPIKSRLQAVIGIRAFAVEALGLPNNASYRSYADVGRPYVVWNVFATPEFSVEPRQWCFPIAGCVAYRGYFNAQKAQDFATRLKRQGLDVSIGGVAAYSTLGHFADPVLNTMMHWNDVQLAAIVFHELTHQVVYVPGDSRFNEAFATVVEEEGVRRWLISEGREAELAAFLLRKHRYLEFSELLTATRDQLRVLYTSGLAADDMRQQKRLAFAELKERYQKLRTSWGEDTGFDSWFARDINNADLVAVATYQDCVPGLEELLRQKAGGDLQRFYTLTRELGRLPMAERHAQVCFRP